MQKQKPGSVAVTQRMETNELELGALKIDLDKIKEVIKSVEVGFDRSVKEAILAVHGKDAWFKSANFGLLDNQSENEQKITALQIEHSKALAEISQLQETIRLLTDREARA